MCEFVITMVKSNTTKIIAISDNIDDAIKYLKIYNVIIDENINVITEKIKQYNSYSINVFDLGIYTITKCINISKPIEIYHINNFKRRPGDNLPLHGISVCLNKNDSINIID